MQNPQNEEISFLRLFYNVLFASSKAVEDIKLLREQDSSRLFFYALGIILLAGFGLSASNQNLNLLIPSIIVWLFTVLSLGFIAWLFRPRKVDIDLSLLFFFCAFAQTPLIFLGLSKLWENSIFPTTGPTIICLIWSIILWGWSLNHSLGLGKLKSVFLLCFALLSPFLILLTLLISIFMAILSFKPF